MTARLTLLDRCIAPRRFGSLAAWLAASLLPSLAAGQAAQEAPGADKSGFTLFNPTPRHLMRPLAADRPDATESPITVDAGHLQIETSFIDYTHDDESDEDVDALTILDTNVKVGVLNNMDLQFVFGAYGEEDTDPGDTLRGFSDLQVRAKVNLWGNDDDAVGSTAFGVMPFVTIPTGTQLSVDEPEGGVIAMLGWNVAETWGLGFQGEVGFVHDDDDDDYDTELAHTTVLGFDVAGPLGAYVEYLGIASTDAETSYRAILSTGLTWAIGADAVWDIGTQIGLNDEADDVNLFTGITLRY